MAKFYHRLIEKYSSYGYAIHKEYVTDDKYKLFLSNVNYLINNYSIFYDKALEIYNKLYKN